MYLIGIADYLAAYYVRQLVKQRSGLKICFSYSPAFFYFESLSLLTLQ